MRRSRRWSGFGKLIETNAGMALWEEAGPKAAAKRRKVLGAFLIKLQSPNPRPKRPRDALLRKPVFTPGDCLAIRDASSGKYAAAIVLLNPIEKPRPGQDTYGVNSIGYLDYFSKQMPEPEVFDRREWLYVKTPYVACPHDWTIAVDHPNVLLWKIVNSKRHIEKFGKPKPDIDVVGRTRLRKEDALDQTFTLHWQMGDEFVESLEAYMSAKSAPTLRRHRSEKELLDHYPKLRDELRSLGSRARETEFDVSPLEHS